MDKLLAPPPAISFARVLAYAVVDETVRFTGEQRLYVDNELLGAVPCIALCEELRNDQAGFFVAYCNEKWEAVAIAPATDPDSAMRQAEHYYRGLGALWAQATVTVHQAREWIARSRPEEVCSFCGRLPFEINNLVRGNEAAICDLCLDAFHADIHTGKNQETREAT